MSERDPVVILLRELDRPVAPRPEFADALRARLLAELGQHDGLRARRRVSRPRLTLAPRHRRPALAGAVALIVAVATITAVLLSRPSPASALDVIQQARRAFATAPPFAATVRLNLNPDGSQRFVPRGATATVMVNYGGRRRFRSEVVSEQPRLASGPSPGSYEVFDGRRVATYDPHGKVLFSFPAPNGFRPLEFLSWRGAYPDWERICGGSASKVLPDAQIAGRDARHVRCVNFIGEEWQLWIDRKTGLLLKLVGQAGGDDLFFGLGLSTSAKGGFEVERLRYNSSFPAGTFTLAAPAGALDFHARLQAAIAKVPPFQAVYSARYGRARAATYIDEAWWLNDQTWRREVLVSRPGDPRGLGGPGSFFVYAHGLLSSYNAHDKSYTKVSSPAFEPINPIVQLVAEADSSYSTSGCPIVGNTQIAGRRAIHRHCKTRPSCPGSGCSYDVWLDTSTGLTLRRRSRMFELRVRSIRYHPHLPSGLFRFVPPAGSRNAQQLTNNPYYKTKLVPGKPAPDWQATKLNGGGFQLADLRGKPVLLLLVPDWCSDPACNVFGPLEQAYRGSKNEATVVWVDFQGSAKQARRVVRENHLTIPVVIDHEGTSLKAWAIQAYPYWLLLDRHGRVIEARLKPQTTSQLQQLLAKAK